VAPDHAQVVLFPGENVIVGKSEDKQHVVLQTAVEETS
jgi:hypothetical protein